MTDEKEDYKETWFIVPRTILDIPGITLSSLKVFETIFQFWNKGRKCFLSNPEIERRTGVKLTQVKDAIAFFEDHKELERIQIGMKRYLMQPLKVVEIPGLAVVPKQVARNQASCTDADQVARNQATTSPKSGQEVASNQATEIKNLNKEKKTNPPISPKGEKKELFSLTQMLEDNPFQIPVAMISDWLEVRKSKRVKMTATAWKGTNAVLQKLCVAGLNPIECFEGMVASGWQGIKVSYFEKEIAALKPKAPMKYVPKEDRAAEYERIAAREREAEARKKAEIESAKGFKEIVKQAKMQMSHSERMAQQEAERKRLGMSVTEYHEHITKGHKEPVNG